MTLTRSILFVVGLPAALYVSGCPGTAINAAEGMVENEVNHHDCFTGKAAAVATSVGHGIARSMDEV